MNANATDGAPFDLSKILDAVRQITAFEVVLASVFLLAWLAGAWFVVLDELKISLPGKYYGLGIAAVVYVIGVILILVERHRRIIAAEARKRAEVEKKETQRKAKEAKKEAEKKAEEAERKEIGRREVARDKILAYLINLENSTGTKIAWNETIRKKVDRSYSDEFLNNLVDHYPRILAKRTRKSDGKVGLARL